MVAKQTVITCESLLTSPAVLLPSPGEMVYWRTGDMRHCQSFGT